MSLSTPFIRRPVATTLLTLALLLAGTLSFGLLPVAPLPNVDFPAIVVSASLPGASPETMASSVDTPLERSLGRIAPLPNVDFPAIVVSASLPGASPETMASSVDTPLERSLGRIASTASPRE